MQRVSATFGVVVSNIPLVNLRWEFREYFRCAHIQGWMRSEDGTVKSLHTPYFTWHGMPEGGVTMMMGRVILGLEAYLPYAVDAEAVVRGISTAEIRLACQNPFSLGRKAADNLFNKLPRLLSPALAMCNSDPKLWVRTDAFYKEVRNPLSHGSQFSTISEVQLAGLFDHMADVYSWIDSWHDPELVMPGARDSFQLDPI